MNRDNVDKLWGMMDDGLIEPRTLAEILLKWMPESELEELIKFYELEEEVMELKFTDITDIDLTGNTDMDYPDFPNLMIDSAWNKVENRPCTDAEMDYIQDNYSQELYELALERWAGE